MQRTICIPKLIACPAKVLLVGFLGLFASQPVWSQCSATPQAALASYGETLPAKTGDAKQDKGYQVWRTVNDPALGRQWFWIKACGPTPQPAQLLWIPLSLAKTVNAVRPSAAQDERMIVRVGDDVIVSQASDALSMRLAGRALQAGELGSSVRVEIHTWHNSTILAGKIVGKDEVRVGD